MLVWKYVVEGMWTVCKVVRAARECSIVPSEASTEPVNGKSLSSTELEAELVSADGLLLLTLPISLIIIMGRLEYVSGLCWLDKCLYAFYDSL